MLSSTLSYHQFNRMIWTSKIIDNPFKEIRNQVNIEKFDLLSFSDTSKDDLNNNLELFANNIINAPSETIKQLQALHYPATMPKQKHEP
ncbi:5978_t:CDS:2 [Cetraspora pellucida]|uniref:5978_t:CDS:1 n=1 Tax=Cetraspora pellucida TaxID=1433469 RepID=A0A9N8VFW6_9GLOM|nr:5978_t:CDS:2 [Cetraspora pellucida]